MSALTLLLGVVLGGLLFSFLIPSNSRTRKYRRDMTNLYVAGKVKQIAKKDDIDLVEEYESFKKYMKKHRLEEQSLDVTIEEDLQEKILEDSKEEIKGGE